jgi:hypothetical protein
MKLKPSPALSVIDALDDPSIVKLMRAALRKSAKRLARLVKSKRS